MWNIVFQSIFTVDDGNNLTFNKNNQNSTVMNDIGIITEDAAKSISLQSNKISRTPDNIPAYFLKKVRPYILDILTYLFNLSIETRTLPSQWKKALVIPIFEKGSRNISTNYRPISLTYVLCRILEELNC